MTGFQQMALQQERDLDDIWLPEAVPETDDILAIDDHSPHQTSGATEGSDDLSLPGSVKNISFEERLSTGEPMTDSQSDRQMTDS